MESQNPVHPLGQKARVLLSSVFGPYAIDDEYGSRKINPMECYQNQVTRNQGAFSLRMFHRSFGLKLIQTNIDGPCTLLDFPSLDRFIAEISEKKYDIVGISAIAPNLGKVKKMCSLLRQYQPQATIVIGGHIANRAGLDGEIDADHIVKGDGVTWFRSFLKQDLKAPVKHPKMTSGFGTRILGMTLRDKPGDTSAILLPSVGCPLGCNFCSTSAFFGGKGKHVDFFETGQELYDVMCDIEKNMKVKSFFVMDENFLLHRKRALELLDLMKAGRKSWALSIFSSAKVLRSYSMDQLAGLGIGWVWMGLEGEESQYTKLKGIDTKTLVKELQSKGIRVLGSSIIGMEDHSAKNIYSVIDYAVSHNSVFHQFMLYTPVSGTPLHKQMSEQGKLLSEEQLSIADSHGQFRFNYHHNHIKNGEETRFLNDAFNLDFDRNGPSLARLIRVLLNGWKTYQKHPEKRIRDRVAWEVNPLRSDYAGAVWAMKKWCVGNEAKYQELDGLLRDLIKEFGFRTRVYASLSGRYIYRKLKAEEKRLSTGWSYEPETFYEENESATLLRKSAAKRSVYKEGKVKNLAMNPT